MKCGYSDKRNIQILISLLKAHNIRKCIVSPGATQLNLVASIQQDDFFTLYSEVDERNAAYMACGMAAESNEPVAIICTGATASRDYLPGLTEAYYRKLPVLAITSTQDISNAGNLSPQFIDRSQHPADTVRMSVHIQTIKDATDEWDVNLKINKALSELTRHGGGPVHINLTSEYASDKFGVFDLPQTRVIRRYSSKEAFPELPQDGKIAITVGAHKQWTKELIEAVDAFCAANDAVVFVDHSSGYYGKYRVLATIAATQEYIDTDIFNIRLLIHMGEQSGDYYTYGQLFRAKEVWRVSEDGEMRDTFHKLTKVFEMPEDDFFKAYSQNADEEKHSYLDEVSEQTNSLYEMIPELPLSNIWLAQTMSKRMPEQSVLHIGVSNTMRSWTFFDLPRCRMTWANTGCRGIDGAMSAAIGMSLVNPDVIHYCVLGDLTFFYELNALGNRHIGNNLRILLVNNGRGTEFRIYQHKAQKSFGDDADPYIAAAGHFGNKSQTLVRDFASSLGFEYYSVSSKEDFERAAEAFLSTSIGEKSMIMEVFTDSIDENNALVKIRNLIQKPEVVGEEATFTTTQKAKMAVRSLIGDNRVDAIKRLIKG